MTIELTPVEEALLNAEAERRGLEPRALAHELLLQLSPESHRAEANSDPTLELFERWDREDAGMTDEERAEEERQWEVFKTNLNAERDRAGARRVF